MEFLQAILVTPFVSMWENPEFLLEVIIGGLLTGVMYSLVALGFVLIYKASGVFNFAQGTMVLFAALTFVGLLERGLPIWASFLVAALAMIAIAFLIERFMLRPLVNQEPIILFMATIGLTYLLDGFGEIVWGGDVHPLDIGIPNDPLMIGGILVNEFDLVAALVCGVLVAGLAVLFQKTAIGRALRAVADDHQAALSVGIPLKTIWVIVWSVAGIVGLTSVPGAIVGGLIVGSGEKVAEVFWAPATGGAIEDWFAYALALIFLLFRPQGLFGERIIERV